MTRSRISDSGVLTALPGGGERWKRRALFFSLPIFGILLLMIMLWNVFFRYVPAGSMLIVISKNGDDLPPGRCWPRRDSGVSRKRCAARAITSSGPSFTPPNCSATSSSSRARSAS